MKRRIIIPIAAVIIIAVAVVMVIILCNKEDEAMDTEEIRKVALDYIEGWYEGSTERMDKALSEDLVKRLIRNDTCETLTKEIMMSYTSYGGGKNYKGDMKNDIKILDVSGNIATVACFSAEYVDYLHLGKINGEWKIINVLWCYKEDITE